MRESDQLARVKRAADRRRRADEEVRAAVLAAADAGATGAAIGRALGITKQGAGKMLRRLTQPRR